MTEPETDDANQVIFIGLDGVGFTEIDDWLAEGALPNLARLIEDGASGTLQSTTPPWTPVAWPSMITGRNPGKHGVFDFFTRSGYEKSLIDRTDVRSPYLWEVLAAQGKTPLVINFPVTHPVSHLERGAIVPGYLASEDAEFFPEHIRADYEEEHGPYRIYPDYGDEGGPAEYRSVAKHRREMARFLDDRYNWDLLAVQFQVTDTVFHDFDDDDRRRAVYEAVDEFVGDIVGLGDDPTVIVASDHGMGDYDGVFYINSWLANNGYCETTTGDVTYFRDTKSELKNTEVDSSTTSLERTLSAAGRVGLTQRRIHSVVETLGLSALVSRLVPDGVGQAAQAERVDWARSMAFQALFNSWGIHLNVANREPSGTVPTDEYEDVRTSLIQRLQSVKRPDGERLFRTVRRREDVYWGDHLDEAPDIVFEPQDCRYDVSGTILDTFRAWKHKNHKPDGIVAVNGSSVTAATVTDAAIYDVAPTIAALLDIPLDEQGDGSALVAGEVTDTTDWDDVAHTPRSDTTKPTDDEAVEDRLRQLGYMD